MNRFFNTTGPCNPQDHYMLPAHERLVGANLDRYIRNKLYWVLHAPRQTGKTTFLQSWMRQINGGGEGVACYVSVERCQGFPAADDAIPAIIDAINDFAGKELPEKYVPARITGNPGSILSDMLGKWAEQVAPKPLIILFDEVDTLQDQAMISFLRQLRSGFAARGVGKFPVSVALVGMRDLRDYLIQSKDGVALNPGSPFNIKENSATLSNFSAEDVARLIAQHSSETGQQFTPEAVARVYDLSRGQPWLVNALCKKCAWELVPEESREAVTADHILQAKELLIKDRAVHLDSLAERLRDPKVRRVVEAILIGKSDPAIGRADRDVELCMDLGLVTFDNGLRIANPIYQEIIPRVLTRNAQDNMPAPEWRWQKDDGALDYAALFAEFQAFWRRNSDAWESKMEYVEAFPHLLVMAFLQRVINGGGRIEREYAAGRGRVDLAVEWRGVWAVIEIKLVHPQDNLETTIEEGLKQTARYRDTVGAKEAWLIVFDRRDKSRSLPWEQRLSTRSIDQINVVTC